ncbi:hypothetical protein AGMMS49928_02740 [Spirochaetia bacterium]|nr:hypothetical protein AGMMS49928_02740 [Spirochaetia bacterium]
MITGIAHVAINVLDMDKMLGFYSEALGLKKAFELPHEDGTPWIVYLKVAPGEFIEFFYGGVKDRDINYSGDQIGAHHWCITCTNMNALRERLLARGYIKPDMKPVAKGDGWNWWIHDPEGNALEINQLEGTSAVSDSANGGRDEITGIEHVGHVVSDIEKTRAFYRDMLGLKELSTKDKDGKPWLTYMEVKPGQTMEFFWGGVKTRPNTWQSYGVTHLCLLSDDVAAEIESLRARGWPILIETKTGADKNTQGWVVDPDGNRIELMYIHPDSPQAKA